MKKNQNLEFVSFSCLDLHRRIATFNIFTKMDAFLRTFLRTNYCNMLIIIFDTFYVSRNFLGFGNWKSGFREIGCIWLFFDQFQHIGHFFHSVLVTEHDFELRISKFQFSRNFWDFGKLSGNSQNWTIFEKWNIFSTQFWSLISIFHLKLVHFAIFCISYDFLEISKFPNPRFQKMLQYEHFLLIC